MAQTIEILMVNQVRANAAAADLVIAPKVKDFGVLQSDGYDEIIAEGSQLLSPWSNSFKISHANPIKHTASSAM